VPYVVAPGSRAALLKRCTFVNHKRAHEQQ
jgi:hypothetical protein